MSPTAQVVGISLTGDNEITMFAMRTKVTADVTLDFPLDNGCTPHGIDKFNKKFIAIPDVKSVVDAIKDISTLLPGTMRTLRTSWPRSAWPGKPRKKQRASPIRKCLTQRCPPLLAGTVMTISCPLPS